MSANIEHHANSNECGCKDNEHPICQQHNPGLDIQCDKCIKYASYNCKKSKYSKILYDPLSQYSFLKTYPRDFVLKLYFSAREFDLIGMMFAGIGKLAQQVSEKVGCVNPAIYSTVIVVLVFILIFVILFKTVS